ncbi:MAG TPA: tetratricopeptide repeat protein, partial [Candidatus Brocadiaceae bacterium]
MKIVLVVILLGITTLFGLFTSVGAQEKMEESFVILMAARNAAKEGLTDKAVQRYEAYLKKKPGDREGGLEYADLLQNYGRYQEADARYEILIELLKEKPEAKDDFARKLLLNAARNAVKNKHEGRAVGYFKKALTYGPDDPQLYWEITGLLAKLGKTEDAFELCEKVLSLESQNREVMMLKINLLAQLKRYSEA